MNAAEVRLIATERALAEFGLKNPRKLRKIRERIDELTDRYTRRGTWVASYFYS